MKYLIVSKLPNQSEWTKSWVTIEQLENLKNCGYDTKIIFPPEPKLYKTEALFVDDKIDIKKT